MMNTEICAPSPEAIARAAEWIRGGEVVGFPTETVYGLGADALNPEAVRKIFLAKGRPADNPLIVHIAQLEELDPLIRGELPERARKLAQAFWPGPLTMILPKSALIPDAVSAGLDTVGIRMPENAVARKLIDAAQRPIAAPSANRSGRPSPTTAMHVLEDMRGRIPMILDGGPCRVGVESTVLEVLADPPRVLRPGGITPAMIAGVLGGCQVDQSVLRPLKEGETARSPGMKYRHYAPKGHLVIVEGPKAAESICRLYDAAPGIRCILCPQEHAPLYGARRVRPLGSGAEGAAEQLFAALREMDEIGAQHIFSESFEATGIGLAVMNRLGRAAAFEVVSAQ
ncbi:MAG: threonylcarbamoyl-AMP synthase [Clostridia bacterium]|nr:threonylcarbamoyl-AMP synthase [Clostridia bacterium]